jgi:hypothetical protein
MFRRPKPTVIESDAGFSVELEGGKLIYREGGKRATFTTKQGEGPILFVVHLGEYSNSWDPLSDNVKISDEDWSRIGNNIREAYRSQGVMIEVHVVPSEVRAATRRRVSMCRMTRANLIESDEGFSVELVELSKLVYREGDKQVTLTVEHLVGPAVFVVYLGGWTDRWDPPFDTTTISYDEWRRIGNNIRDAYRSQGCEIEVDIRSMSSEEREAFKRALEQLKHPSATSFSARRFASFKRALERLKRALSKR